MPRIHLYLDVSDQEASNFLARFTEAGKLATTAPNGAPADDGDEPGVVTGADRDKNGVPWLEAVHASTKKQTGEGRWTRRKGVSEAARDAAEQPYRSATASPTPPPAAAEQIPSFLTGGQPVQFPPVGGQPVTGLPGFPMPMPAAPMAFPMPAAPPVITYDDLVKKFEQLTAAGKITQTNLLQLYGAAGIDAARLPELQTNETWRSNLMAVLNSVG